ncbi:MAG: choice-of-anchor J domain-containing protein [Muribaculaceae bacterium]|nr:choice-of-anchor J domain-containing protein [Muribaculaceae bacterium]
MRQKFYFISAAVALAGISATLAAMQSTPQKATQPVRDYSMMTPAHAGQSVEKLVFNNGSATLDRNVRSNDVAKAPAASNLVFGGALHFSTGWEDGTHYGLYTFTSDPDGADKVELISEYWFFQTGNATVIDNALHAVDYNQYDDILYVNYNKVDLATGDYLGWGSYEDLSMLPFDSDFDPLTGGAVGCFQKAGSTDIELAIVDYDTNYRRVICDLPDILYTVAVDSKGDIYGIDANGVLRLYPRSGGEPTEIMNTGLYPVYMQSATFDKDTDLMYWAFTDGDNSALYEIDPANATISKIYDFNNREEFTCLYVKKPVNMKAPATPASLTMNLDPQGAGTAEFTLPATDREGNALNGTVDYKIYANGDLLAEGSGSAGEEISCPVTTPLGDTHFRLVCSNADGESYSAKVLQWVGDGVPEAVTMLNCKVEDNDITISWEAPTGGVKGGYIDPEALTYTVTRYPEEKVVAENISDKTFSETLNPEQPMVIWYGVTATYKNNTGEENFTQKVPVGDAYNMPYFEDFENPDNFALFTVIDSNDDGRVWMIALHQGWNPTGFAFCNTNKFGLSGIEYSDDWLLTPKLNLSADDVYVFKFKAWTMGSSEEIMEVALGHGEDPTDAAAYSIIFEPTRIQGNFENPHRFSHKWIPEADGQYRIAFHGLSGMNGANFNIDELDVHSIGKAAAPAAGELKVTGGEKGAKEVNVTFTAPTMNARGDVSLSEITKAQLFRGDKLIKEWSDVKPGETLSYVDTDVEFGSNDYSMVCYSSEGQGVPAEANAFVGRDIPAQPLGFKAIDKGNCVELVWENPGAVGSNGGYADDTAFTYEVYNIVSNAATPISTGLEETSYIIENTGTGNQSRAMYGVSAIDDGNLGDIAVSNVVILGEGHKLPYVETFNMAKYDNEGWLETGDTEYIPGEGFYEHIFYTDPEVSSDEGSTSIFWQPQIGFRSTAMSTGKIIPGEASALYFILDRRATADCDVKIDIYVNVDGWQREFVKTIDLAEATDKTSWHTEVIDIVKYGNANTLSFDLEAHGDALNETVWLDRIQVRNLLDKDLMASLEAKKTYTAGKAGQVVIKVDNNSLNEASGYKVNLYVDGKLSNSVDGKTIPALSYMNYEMEVTPAVNIGTSLDLRAEVIYDGDMDDTNNVAEKTSNVVESALEAPTDLRAGESADGITLNWTAPEVVDAEVTEGFETYDNGDLVFGDWKTYDLDKGLACGINNHPIPHEREPFAYMVFNPIENNLDITKATMYEPVADDQYLMCMKGYYSSLPHNDDWLISPELSGDAQTIYMFLRKYGESYTETFEIWYSLTDDDLESFILLEQGSVDEPEWDEYSYDLPEGTKYFAFRYTAANGFFIFLDEISYHPLVPELTGYRIYRDGELLVTLSADDTTYFIGGADAYNSDYFVTAVYKQGESMPSNHASISGVNITGSDGRSVLGGEGEILITGLDNDDVKVYAVDGKCIASFIADGTRKSVKADKGQYVVKVGRSAAKVIVR